MTEPSARWFKIQLFNVAVPSEVVFRALAQETVLLNMRTGQYHGLDPIGARFFEVMRDSSNVSTACDALAAEYDQPLATIRIDLLAFLEDMESRGLLELQE